MRKHLLTAVAAVVAASFSANAETLNLTLDDLGAGWGSSYDAATKTITFDSPWTGRGWWLSDVDYSAFDEVTVETEPTAFAIKLVVEYANDVATTDKMGAKGDSSISVTLNPDGAAHVRQIYIQSSDAGTVVLKAAYLSNAAVFDPNANVTIFEGSAPIAAWSWDADKSYSLPLSKLTDNKVVAGNALQFSYTATADAASVKYFLVHSDWSNDVFAASTTIEGYSDEWQTVGFSGASVQTMLLDEAAVEAINSPSNMKILISGDGAVLNKIEIVRHPGGDAVETIDASNAAAEYFNLQGVRIAEPAAGQLVICRQGNKAVKMIAK